MIGAIAGAVGAIAGAAGGGPGDMSVNPNFGSMYGPVFGAKTTISGDGLVSPLLLLGLTVVAALFLAVRK